MLPTHSITVRRLGQWDYQPVWRAMQDFTDKRTEKTVDELWLVEHRPVYTLGQAGKREHVLDPGAIPVIPVDRGGQVTYHGPGQVVLYALLDLRRLKLGVRDLVSYLENALIAVLTEEGVQAAARPEAPGVYVDGCKIAALGLRIRRGCSFHGLSLNVNMDLEPFTRINPCGFTDIKVVQTRDLGICADVDELGERLVSRLVELLGYNSVYDEKNLPPPLRT